MRSLEESSFRFRFRHSDTHSTILLSVKQGSIIRQIFCSYRKFIFFDDRTLRNRRKNVNFLTLDALRQACHRVYYSNRSPIFDEPIFTLNTAVLVLQNSNENMITYGYYYWSHITPFWDSISKIQYYVWKTENKRS